MVIMIAIFAVVGIAAIIQIGRMARNKSSLDESGTAATSLDKEALEKELKAELLASMEEDKKASQVGQTESPEPGLTVSEEEAEAKHLEDKEAICHTGPLYYLVIIIDHYYLGIKS